MAPKKDKDKPPEFMTISGQTCRRVKDSNGKFVYRPIQADGSDVALQAKPKNDEEEEKKWIQMKEREVQEARVRDARQQSAKQMREKEKLGLVEKSGRSREPTLKVPAPLQRLRDEHEAALKVGMSTSKPGEYLILKEALDIEEKRFQAKVKEAKEKAYKRTRGKLRVGGRAGIDESDGDLDEEDIALVPKQELHDIDDYRRDLPITKPSAGRVAPQPSLWSANGHTTNESHSNNGSQQKQGGGNSRPGSARQGRGRGRGGNPPRAEPGSDSLDMNGLSESLPEADAKPGRGGRGGRAGGSGGGNRGHGGRGGGHANNEIGVDASASSNGHGGRGGRSKGGNRGKGRGRGEMGREQKVGQAAVVNTAG
uniref:Uncharacterized protein n=1 Tax=Tetraselmis chuii TaxID=63592 RepID=A0A7S1SKM9_9CHLO|mmetsp:Transcript_17338/g.30956  ORF Transcript_17338/g.30956 Transcript_17338/m.30956 type:complete len:368 (+) Transcript_17338:161-1264(+)|eukprot:CAMPEP_0177765900 /NCGR_PEP_ID=MMETSP0491_2-20121128/8232_1 /TAXON_ID=63592 /ORGANISM="Tetraselmis chuii, Strain PLY429" /LENGTH=367 /DNA_ID=CAMNT_0019282267 /DNA_START=154 /DNA_END=1257 /DNA_ORIENTATION=+